MLTEVLAEMLQNGNFGGEISGLVNADILQISISGHT
jgi:hypothetical protein